MATKSDAIYKTIGRVKIAHSLMYDFGVHESCGTAISKQFEKARKEIDKLYAMLDAEGTKMKLNSRFIMYPNIGGYKQI